MISFRLKTIIGIGTIETILLLILIVTSLNLLKTTKEDELVKLATSTAILFSTTTKDAVLATDMAALDSFVSEVMKNPGLVYARVLSDQVGLLAEQTKTGKPLSNFVLDRDIDDVSDGVFDTFAEIKESGFVYGRVELGFSIAEVDQLVSQAKRKTFIIALVELFLSAMFSLFLGFYLTRQLSELKLASQTISEGQFGFQIKVKGHDELAQTAKTFNQMSTDLQALWYEREQAQKELEALNASLENKVAARTRELEDAQQIALENAHRAGMADIAAGALHNIGNLINSAKISTNLLITQVDKSKLFKLQKANELLSDNLENIDTFVQEDKGKALLSYYITLGEALQTEHEQIQTQLEDIKQGIELTAQTISEQRTYAKNPMRFESMVNLSALMDEVLLLLKLRIETQAIDIIKNIDPVLPEVLTQKNKLHQVFLNLMINALDAIESNPSVQGQIVISMTSTTDENHNQRVKIVIQDNGCGIKANMLDTIFNYGVTTKASGSGAGLHSSANLVTEMNGTMTVSSQGPQLGANFTLCLPLLVA